MVDLATFRTFPRASPARPVPAAPDEPIAAAEKETLTDSALPARFSQELRARRRAARTDMRQSDTWADGEGVEASYRPIEAPGAVEIPPRHEPAIAAPAVDEPPAAHNEWSSETIAPAESPPHGGGTDHGAPSARAIEPEPEHYEAEPAHAALALEGLEPPVPASEHFDAHEEQAADPGDEGVSPTFPPVAEEFGHAAGVHAAPEATHEGAGSSEYAEPMPWSSDEPSPPIPIQAFMTAPDSNTSEAQPAPSPIFDQPAPDEVWPVEPPSTVRPGETLPIAPPPSFEPAFVSPPAPPVIQDTYSSDSIALDYRLLGLANPLVCKLTGKLGDAVATELSVGQAGIYRPDGFRPAPWSGLAYDVSPDGRRGLAIGTRILTARGEIAVEDLVPGDSALALRGPALLPIVWIGRSMASPPPIHIAADSFGPGRPSRALRVGADHPIFMETMPVAARDLVNGGTIRTVETETEELFHIDVGFAEVLLAEGVPLSSGCR